MINGISIVICCYNSENRLPKVLEHLEVQEAFEKYSWEIIVVDNASSDRTAEVARELWKRKDVPLRVEYESTPGLSNARLNGIKNSKFDIISFIDDDNWVEPNWIKKVFEIMDEDSSIALLGGRGEAAFEKDPPFWFEQYQGAFAVGSYGKKTGKQKTMIPGAGMNMRRSAWDYLRDNGFDFILTGRKGAALSSGEDQELSYAFLLAGFDIYYDNDLTFYHYMPSGRLQWNYLVKLYGAFARSAPVLNYYQILFVGAKGIKRLTHSNSVFSVLRSLYKYLSYLPRLIPLIVEKREGNYRILRYATYSNILKERIRLIFIFPGYVSRIKNGKWNKGL